MIRGHLPSRTYTMSVLAILSLTLIALALLTLVCVLVLHGAAPPETTGQLLTTLQIAMGGIAGAGGIGSGSMAIRDFGSKGLTSSQGAVVAAATSPVDPPPAAESLAGP